MCLDLPGDLFRFCFMTKGFAHLILLELVNMLVFSEFYLLIFHVMMLSLSQAIWQ